MIALDLNNVIFGHRYIREYADTEVNQKLLDQILDAGIRASYGLVHYEQYHDYTDEEIIEIYQERNEKGWKRYMENPRLKELTERLGLKNLAQVYTVAKYTKESHLEFSQTVLKYLENQNFMNNE